MWSDYELIDCGNFEKLERFGKYYLIRPEPQALWNKSLSEQEWNTLAHAKFVRDNSKKSHREVNNENGGWKYFKPMPSSWEISYTPLGLKLKLACTSFGHLGVFVEQVSNWHFIQEQVLRIGKSCKVLNLFAYTGAASIVAAKAGADVTHVDSVKSIITWANENKTLSQADGIRWLVDDALKYVRRQAKKGNLFHGIIIDPPAYGRGPEGEKWILEEQINELLFYCAQFIDKNENFILLNLYSMGLSGTIGTNLIESNFKEKASWGECLVNAKHGFNLPLCTWVRSKK